MTNADKIRNMTDEELANFLVKGSFQYDKYDNKYDCYNICQDAKAGCGFTCNHLKGNDVELLTKWLKSQSF